MGGGYRGRPILSAGFRYSSGLYPTGSPRTGCLVGVTHIGSSSGRDLVVGPGSTLTDDTGVLVGNPGTVGGRKEKFRTEFLSFRSDPFVDGTRSVVGNTRPRTNQECWFDTRSHHCGRNDYSFIRVSSVQ